MSRPREHNIDIPNLYRKFDKRTGKIYWQYYNQMTNKFSGMGVDEAIARTAAIELNRIIADKQIQQSFALVDAVIDQSASKGVRVHDWIEKYKEMLDRQLERGELASTTVRNRKLCASILGDRLMNIYLVDVGAKEMAALLEEYKDMGKLRMAQLLRSVWISFFKEAQYAGEVPPGFNPALATRRIKANVRRARINFDEWKLIYEASLNYPHYVTSALLLALVTGQRVGDIAKMQFKDVWDGYLHVKQEKTGNKIAIPLSLHCNAIGMSLGDVIRFCRDRVVSKYMVHHSRTHQRVKIGQGLNKTTLSKMFADLRDEVGIKPPKGKTPTTFHEQRSLSERLYHAQGINTQLLLGHSNATMTEEYHNERNDSWIHLAI